MRYPEFMRDPDRNAVICFMLVGIALVIAFNYHPAPDPLPSVPITHTKIVPISDDLPPSYASPNKTEVPRYHRHQEGMVDYSLSVAKSFYTIDHVLQYATYYVDYNNLMNSPVTITPTDAMNVGCIAAGNKSFQETSSIFSSGGFARIQPTGYKVTSLKAWSSQHNFTLGPYEKVQVEFAVDGSCQYLGTADGQYWWKMGLQ